VQHFRAATTRGGVVAEGGPSVLGDQSRFDWTEEQAAGRRGRGFVAGNAAASQDRDGLPGGDGSGGDAILGRGAAGRGFGAGGDAAGVGGPQAGSGPGGPDAGRSAGGGSGPGDAILGDRYAGPSKFYATQRDAAAGSTAAGDGPTAGSATSGGQTSGGQANGGQTSGGQMTGGAGSTPGGSGAAGGMASAGGQPAGAGGSLGGPSMPGLAQPGGAAGGMLEGASEAPGSASLAGKRGSNWASLATRDRPIPLRRPIRLECAAHEFRILDDGGGRVETRIPIGGTTADSIDPLVAAVHAKVGRWGIAGDRMYWKPELVLSATADGRSRREELERLLADSGLETRPAASQDGVRPLPPVDRTGSLPSKR
jgi:hypothetical protein